MSTDTITRPQADPDADPATASAAGEGVSIRPVDIDRDTANLHAWLSHPRAHYWQMTELDETGVRDYLTGIDASADDQGWIGAVDGLDCFYVETYTPATLIPHDVLLTGAGDLGMHLLVAPPQGPAVSGLTGRIMAEVMDFCFRASDQDGRGAERVVVEPDARNAGILEKNRAAGFTPIREAEIAVGEETKTALVSTCTRGDFAASELGRLVGHSRAVAGDTSATPETPAEVTPNAYAHLNADTFAVTQRHLVAKALSEFAHERLITPVRSTEPAAGPDDWQLHVDGGSRYTFTARVLPLEHWAIDEGSITRRQDGTEVPLDAQELVVELQDALAIPEDLISTYLEELASTLAGSAFKLAEAWKGRRPSSTGLLDADFQATEAAMTEGHPGFIANNGRIGFSLGDYRTWAPENGRRNRIEWVAASREHSHLSLGTGLTEAAHLDWALSPAERELFDSRIRAAGRSPEDFHLLPVHPWQADHRLAITFAADIARGDLLPLGTGLDEHQAQQSLRTFFNHSRPGAPYVKVALAVQNMGFLRGLSPKYMRDTPAINDWVADLVGSDPSFAEAGFRLLRERSALGYAGDVYHRTQETNPHRKMLASLWRENPLTAIAPAQKVVTMASLLHRDHRGVSYAAELIRASGLSPADWVRAYLRAYLQPLVHALLAHDLVFMPHGENLILVLDEHTVTGAFMKDIGEEVAVVGRRELPADVERIRALVPGDEKALSVFTDMFDGVLRHLSGILDVDGLLPAGQFWSLVAEVLDRYESEHPEHARGVSGDVDLRSQSFAHSCLNRLQLKNTKQMVDIGNQAESLLYAGTMDNPVAR
ncbi:MULTISPECIES: GNAT family N-acetyltransferase [unclassified Brevibacterium]|uniref:GNAT family N-acetyltransferase n=1 Tax=unclassified Brevibacterium TaxID=2614124 RepID=UPI001E59AC01|nr:MULTISPECIES: GNAT family N-acetyltransferase [unclassified Brevibacterium]MCD1285599.1 siderophore synthetase [Brevibacterium sp. CCUG 69071]MDK8434654.1 GNAT family N-acetyltransferase [Brevibacterium sp. H-BE7]